MDTNKWRPSQVGEAAMDAGDWRSQLQADSRERIINKIMDTLKRHLPFSGQDGLQELSKIAVRFEEKIYTAATSQSDYLRKISLKMLTMETKSQNSTGNPLQSNSAGNSNRPPDPGSFGMQPQVPNQGMQSEVPNHGQSFSMPLPANQSQGRQPLLSQNIQNNIPPAGVQSSSGLSSALPPSSGLTQTPIPSIVGQNPNMQNTSGSSQNSLGNSMGQGVPSNVFANSQRQMPGRQQVVPQQQQLQQSQNSQQYMYHQHPLLKPKYQQGNMPQLVQQQQQQNLLQPTKLQSSQQSVMPTSSVMQPSVQSSLSSLQQNQKSARQQSSQPMLQQHSQPVLRQQQQPQQAAVHQQQTPMAQQPILPPQQQQPPLMVQQPTASNLSQNQMIGQQNNVGDMQQQQQQRLLNQQNNLLNLQQQQQQQQQQLLMAQQSSLSNIHQQQLGPQSNVTGLQQQQQSNLSNMHQQQLGSQSNGTGLQQQQHLGTQSGNSSMQPNQHSVHLLQQSKVQVQQQQHQNASNMLPTQGQQSQPQASQQQMMSQIQSQPAQMQQMSLREQSNPLQRDVQQRLQASGQISGTMLQAQNVMDQQKQLYQSQRPVPETSSTSLDSSAQTGHANGGDWQEEVYQKIKVMKEKYLPELSEMYQKIATKLQQHDSLPQQPKSEQLEKLKMFKTMLERLISILQVSKSNISPGLKDKLGLYEKQIVNFINTNRPRKQGPPLQQGQLTPPHLHSMQQPQSQIPQVQSHENQMNLQLQTMNLRGSVPTMQQNNMTSLQQNSMSLISGVSTALQNMMNSLQLSTNLDSGQGNALNSLQQVPVGSIQQTPVSAPQLANMNGLSSQSGVSMLQPNINSLQSNSGMLQHQQLKQQEQQMLQNQLKQQYQQRMQQQLIQKQLQQQQRQQQLQQQLQQAKQQLPAQMEANQHQMPQLHQMNDADDLKMRQGMGVKPGVFQQHMSSGQRAYPHQQLKSGSPFPIPSSYQLLQAASPQISQHSSPQVDHKNLLTHPKAGTPLQTACSPFVIPSPSTPMAPSPMPWDSEKPSSLPNAGNIGHQQAAGVGAPVQSFAIGSPGISASPLLAEFSVPDGSHVNALSTISGKSSVTEQPLERLIKAEKSMSPNALSASVSDIDSDALSASVCCCEVEGWALSSLWCCYSRRCCC
ncbi:mediator of RNA polymerase II transcription subunit 15a-like isoform X1 [Pyrus communis]|uniref:mediator of RNA polymerase II transcription subunit 15a-like isoform X1 n=1 Tax=Pyrus communis TaxID=23211 RepID=UPI0035C08614